MSVKYNVSTLLKEPIGSTREYDIDDRVLVNDEPRHERVTGHTTFLRTRDGVLVTAYLQGTQGERCSRCLQELALPLTIEIEEEFYAGVDSETGAGISPPEDPDAFRVDAKHTLDLEEAVRQYWTTAVPIQPLCRPDCSGICPRCGRDVNEGPCSCPPGEDER